MALSPSKGRRPGPHPALSTREGFALLEEAGSVRNLLCDSVGTIRSLRLASLHGDGVFTLGSIGVEKATKVMLGCNEDDPAGSWPSKKPLKGDWGHDHREAKSAARHSYRTRPSEVHPHRVRGDLRSTEAPRSCFSSRRLLATGNLDASTTWTSSPPTSSARTTHLLNTGSESSSTFGPRSRSSPRSPTETSRRWTTTRPDCGAASRTSWRPGGSASTTSASRVASVIWERRSAGRSGSPAVPNHQS